jgi:hypothetical protein
MRNFVIFHTEREGTSQLVRLLNNFKQISIVHPVNNSDWEPFNIHNCGPMPLRNLERCLEMIFSNEPIDFIKLNQIYTRMVERPLENFSNNGAVGFKMRFTAPRKYSPFWNRLLRKITNRSFRPMIFNVLKRNDVIAFLAVRQDVLKWALSKYHGDGTGKPGHLQFKLASGKIKREEIGKIHVDCARLEKIIKKCLKSHARRRRLMEDFKLARIQTHPLCYEDILTDKQQFLSRILNLLELKTSTEEIEATLRKVAYFKKVHSDDISDFVENHEEVKEKYGNCFVSWC